MGDLLVVCRANLCRSPAVAAMVRDQLPAGDPLSISSGGLRPSLGATVPREIVGWLAERGIDVSAHEPTGLTRADVDTAQVVVVMTRSQRSGLVAAFPAALRRTVLLGEAADRVHRVADGSLRVRPGSTVGAPDLVDPYGLPVSEVAAILSQAEQHARALVTSLGVGPS